MSHLIEVRGEQSHQLSAAYRQCGAEGHIQYTVQFTQRELTVNLQVFLLGLSLLLVLVILEVPKAENNGYACKMCALQMFLF